MGLHSHNYYANTHLFKKFIAKFIAESPQIESKQKGDFIEEWGYNLFMLWRVIIFWLPVSYVVPALLLLVFEDFLTKYKFFNEILTSYSLPPIYWIICTIIFVLLVIFFEFRKKGNL